MTAPEPLSPVEVAQIERQYSEDEAHMCVPRLIATLRAVEVEVERLKKIINEYRSRTISVPGGPVMTTDPRTTGDPRHHPEDIEGLRAEIARLEKLVRRRPDGWPLCPSCGEDELSSPLTWNGKDKKPPISAYEDAGLTCYLCHWRKTP